MDQSKPHPESGALLRMPQTCSRNPSKVIPVSALHRRGQKRQAVELGDDELFPEKSRKLISRGDVAI